VKRKIYEELGSYWLACVLLGFLFVLTFLGTIEQVDHGLYEVQKKYFDSLFLVHWVAGTFPIPLPGVYLVLIGLGVNLVIGGLIRIRKSRATLGVIVIHVGILIMLAAGFVKLKFSNEGNVMLYERGRASPTMTSAVDYQSYYEWEVAIWDAAHPVDVKELLIPDTDFADLQGDKTRKFTSPRLPFELELSHFEKNARVLRKGPMWQADGPVVDGFAVKAVPLDKEAENNVATLYCKVNGKDGILFGMEQFPLLVDAKGKWAIALRKKRYKMPFTVTLEKFTHELYPNTGIAKVYASDVTVAEDQSERHAKIEMNAPLRDHGLVLFQASWGPEAAPPGTPLYSVFAVVQNPSDQWPLISCIVIAVGMLIAFSEKLLRYIRAQQAERKA
jgi:hypothetical protein